MREHEHLPVLDAAQRYTKKIADAKLQRHVHAANGTTQHHALAMQFDLPHEAVGTGIMRLETDWQREGVEPHCAARPGGIDPTCCCLTPHDFCLPAGIVFPVVAQDLKGPRSVSP